MPDILKELLEMAIFVICIPIGVFLIKTGIQIARSDKEIYNRNREASILARKYSREKELTREEQKRFDYLLNIGVIEKIPPKFKRNGEIQPRAKLSDNSLDEIFG